MALAIASRPDKEGSGSQWGLWLFKVAQQTALRGGLIALSCPMMPA